MTKTIWLHDLADAARSSGLEVIEVPNWRTRSAAPHGGRFGGPGMDSVQSIMIHHTATPETFRTDMDYPTYNVILQGNGSTGGPLSQLGLCRCGRHVYVFAAGICWHAGAVHNFAIQGNRVSIGIEAEHSGNPRDMPWPSNRYSGYVVLTAALLQWYGLATSRAVAHKEASTTGKIDPLFDMRRFRADVDRARKTPAPGITPDPNEGFKPAEIRDRQRQLNEIGYTDDAGNVLDVDGSLGPLTRQAVVTYQRDFTLSPDGLPGPATTASLEDTMSKLNEIIATQKAHTDTLAGHTADLATLKGRREAPTVRDIATAVWSHAIYGFTAHWWVRRGSLGTRTDHANYPADPGSPADLDLRVAEKVLGEDVTPYDGTQKREPVAKEGA